MSPARVAEAPRPLLAETLSITPAVVSAEGVNHYYGEGAAHNQVLFDNRIEVPPGQLVVMRPVRRRQDHVADLDRRAAFGAGGSDRGPRPRSHPSRLS